MKRFGQFLLATLYILAATLPAAAQFGNVGKLDTWTVKPVSRDQEPSSENTYVKTVRAAKQKDFDRFVFEFEGAFPHYRIEYSKSRFYDSEGGRRRIRTPGRAFLMISLLQVSADDKQVGLLQAKGFLPKGNLRMPSLWSIDDLELFEGVYDFVAGVSARKAFRVTELRNPSRLVIDFQH
ncbi:MAG TPA: hypothetical protein VNG71_07875 [Pyrinomonadaceae bacterium]|nr:hypothetical protein [Pyrinomonadaceae bacterium]